MIAMPAEATPSGKRVPSAHGSDEPWGSYFAVHRSGAIEFGLGQRGGWGGQDRAGNPLRTIALTPTVARVWATLRLAAALQERHVLDVPLQLTVGVADTGGAVVGRGGTVVCIGVDGDGADGIGADGGGVNAAAKVVAGT